MGKSSTGVLSLGLIVTAAVSAFAQGLPTSQPPILRIYREDVKPGRSVEHTKNEMGWVAAYERAKSPDYYLAMESLTSNEAWFVVPAASYSAVGEQMARDQQPAVRAELDRLSRLDGDLLNNGRIIELRALPELSFGTYPDVAQQRFWEVTFFRMRPGSAPAMTAAVKAYAAAAQRAGRTMGWRLYEVSAGMPAPTFVVFASVTKFGEFDTLRSQGEATGKAIGEADSQVFTKFNEGLINTETFRMRLSPEMSYVSAEVRASDPAFWKPKKPAPAKTVASESK
jgi:hypothetical protein